MSSRHLGTMRIMIVMKDQPGIFYFSFFQFANCFGGSIVQSVFISFLVWGSQCCSNYHWHCLPRCNELYSSVFTIPAITIILNTTKTDKMLNVSVSTNRCFTIHFKTILFQCIFSEISETSTIFTHFLFAKSSESITSLCQRPPSVLVTLQNLWLKLFWAWLRTKSKICDLFRTLGLWQNYHYIKNVHDNYATLITLLLHVVILMWPVFPQRMASFQIKIDDYI